MDMTDAGRETVRLPELYAPWMAALLGGEVPEETRATCDDCAMAKPTRPGAPAFFDPHLKCCTAYPTFPNFLVGRILRDRAGGADRMRGVVEGEGDGIATPFGVGGDPAYFRRYTRESAGFGRDLDLRCPFLADDADRDATFCSVWSDRPSTCTTWYCRAVRGHLGAEFWFRMDRLLTGVEDALRRWCVVRMDLPIEVLGVLDQRLADPDAARDGVTGDVWGPWDGRRVEFFERTAALTEDLSWSDVLRIGGSFLEAPARLLAECHRRLIDDALPARLAVGEHRIEAAEPGGSWVVGYSVYDPLRVPADLLRVLSRFSGRSPEGAIRTIAEEEGLTVTLDQVRSLLVQGILRPGKPDHGPGADGVVRVRGG